MELDRERQQIFGELLMSVDDIKHGRLYSADEVEAHMKDFLDQLDAEDDA